MPKGVGVYIGSNEVIAVSVIRSSSGLRIKASAIETIPPEEAPETSGDPAKLPAPKMTSRAAAIRRALEKIEEPGAYVTAAVSASQVATRQFIMPPAAAEHTPEAIRLEASRYMPFQLADSIMDHSIHMTHKKVLSVTATAIRKEVLETSLRDLRAASAKVLMVEPVYSAISRGFDALRMVGKGKSQGFVALQSDGNVNVTLAAQGVVYLSRDFVLSGIGEEDQRRFFEELSASIDYFYRLTGGETIGQIFLAGHGDLRMWMELLERDFHYKIRFDVARFPEKDHMPPREAATLLVAFGLALQGLDLHAPLGDVKLLPPSDRLSGPRKLLALVGWQTLGIVLVFLLIQFAILLPYRHVISRPHEKLLSDVAAGTPFFETRSMASLKAEKKDLTGKVAQLNAFFRAPLSFSSVLSGIGRGLPQAISLDAIEIGTSQSVGGEGMGRGALHRLSLQGLCSMGNGEKETSVISVWAKALAAKRPLAEYFPEIKIASVERERAGGREMTRFLIVDE